jgi:signal peptidase II
MRLLALLGILLVTGGCDQVSKHVARTGLRGQDAIVLPGGFMQLSLAENSGAFLSLGASLPPMIRAGVVTVGVSVALAVLLVYMVRKPGLPSLAFFGMSLIWAGGVSNLVDRLTRDGRVTDFLFLRAGPLHTGVFNIADMAVLAGALLVIVSSHQQSRSDAARTAGTAAP